MFFVNESNRLFYIIDMFVVDSNPIFLLPLESPKEKYTNRENGMIHFTPAFLVSCNLVLQLLLLRKLPVSKSAH